MQKKTKIKLSVHEVILINSLFTEEMKRKVDSVKNVAIMAVMFDFWVNSVIKKVKPKVGCLVSIPYTVSLCFYAFYNGRKIDNEEAYLLVNKILAEIDKAIDSQIRLKSFEISEVGN